jgi:hypothetical protein
MATCRPRRWSASGPRARRRHDRGRSLRDRSSAGRTPEELLRELVGAGATLVSLNPVRETLEDVFVRRVAAMGDGARPTAIGGRER